MTADPVAGSERATAAANAVLDEAMRRRDRDLDMRSTMRSNPVRRTMRVLVGMTVGAVLAGAVIGTGIARADGVVTAREWRFVNEYGARAICPLLVQYPTQDGTRSVIQAVYDRGWPIGDAADIVAASINQFCPSFHALQRYAEQTGRGGQPVSHTSVTPGASPFRAGADNRGPALNPPRGRGHTREAIA